MRCDARFTGGSANPFTYVCAFFFIACGAAADNRSVENAPQREVAQLRTHDPNVVIEGYVPKAPPAETPPARSDPKRQSGPFAGTTFPPDDPGPVHERSARPGDGVWRPFFWSQNPESKDRRYSDPEMSDYAGDVVRRIVLHPHQASQFQTLTLAAFDLRHLEVAHRPGRKDVTDVGRQDLASRAGLVPLNARAKLLAVFNGGFQPRHGRWGMLSLGEQLIPPREDACTVATMKDGTVRLGPWPSVSSLKGQIVAYRQTPPCLVAEGVVHERLQRGDRKPWAGQVADRKTRRRSVVGISKDGRTLFYGVGSETEAEVLAAGMVHVGAHFAAQLDINWNWTRLFLFGGRDDEVAKPRPLGSLIKDMARDKGEYVDRAAARGFFFVSERQR